MDLCQVSSRQCTTQSRHEWICAKSRHGSVQLSGRARLVRMENYLAVWWKSFSRRLAEYPV